MSGLARDAPAGPATSVDIPAPRPRRKETIPAYVREEVWRRYGGAVCWCCQTEPISPRNKHYGHVVAEAAGGPATVENLRPVCAGCNLRMGTRNMYDFMVAEGHPLRDAAAIHRVLLKDPSLVAALRGREVFAVPTITSALLPAPEYDYVLRETLLKQHPFLAPVVAAGKLDVLFAASESAGITFRFILRPDFVRWARHQQEAARLEKVEAELV